MQRAGHQRHGVGAGIQQYRDHEPSVDVGGRGLCVVERAVNQTGREDDRGRLRQPLRHRAQRGRRPRRARPRHAPAPRPRCGAPAPPWGPAPPARSPSRSHSPRRARRAARAPAAGGHAGRQTIGPASGLPRPAHGAQPVCLVVQPQPLAVAAAHKDPARRGRGEVASVDRGKSLSANLAHRRGGCPADLGLAGCSPARRRATQGAAPRAPASCSRAGYGRETGARG